MSQKLSENDKEHNKVMKSKRLITEKELQEKVNKGTSGLTMFHGKDIREYDNIDIDELLNQLTDEQIEQLNNEIDPDDTMIPASMRCPDQTKKTPTGPFDRERLLSHLEKCALEQEDWPEFKPYQAGLKRGKVWIPKEKPKKIDDETKILLDLDDETANALNKAKDEDLVDLAGILGLHSMLNQDQFHASVSNKGQSTGAKFESVVKATQYRIVPDLPDNHTDPEKTAAQVAKNDPSLRQLIWNNLRNIPRDTFKKLFDGLANNTFLEHLELANTGLTDGPTARLVEALKTNSTLKNLNVESNFLSGPMIRDILRGINCRQKITEFRATNQKPATLGNRIEMEIASLAEENSTLLRLGLHFDAPAARMRVTRALQNNKDRVRLQRIGQAPSPDKI